MLATGCELLVTGVLPFKELTVFNNSDDNKNDHDNNYHDHYQYDYHNDYYHYPSAQAQREHIRKVEGEDPVSSALDW